MKVRVKGKVVEQFSCECPDCNDQEHDGDHIDVDMKLTVDRKLDAEHEAEEKLFQTFEKFNNWESYYWETIEITIL